MILLELFLLSWRSLTKKPVTVNWDIEYIWMLRSWGFLQARRLWGTQTYLPSSSMDPIHSTAILANRLRNPSPRRKDVARPPLDRKKRK